MLTKLYIEALLVDEGLADQVWEAWGGGIISDALAANTWALLSQEIPSDQISNGESLPKRSAVVTRRSEPAMTRALADLCKFSPSDAAQSARFRPDERRTPAPMK
jgi:hypothetical protein